MKVTIKKPTEDDLKNNDVLSWPIWEKEVSEFDWHYDTTEECFLLKGKVIVTTDIEEVEFGEGDFVTFPKGLSCKWKIIEPVKKHYNFI